jgi:antitoxin HicB
MKKAHLGSTLESLFEETGELEEVRALAVKKMIVDQYLAAMNERKLSVSALSRRMSTSRAAVKRLLDPKSKGVTLDSLGRAAAALGKDLQIRLVPNAPSTVSKSSTRRSPTRAPARIGRSLKGAASR